MCLGVTGAVMFLFRGDFGCLLYTGDFRWEATSERAKTGRNMLLNALKDDSVDILYLDNTYCNPSFDFPPRHVAAQQVKLLAPTFFFNNRAHFYVLNELVMHLKKDHQRHDIINALIDG